MEGERAVQRARQIFNLFLVRCRGSCRATKMRFCFFIFLCFFLPLGFCRRAVGRDHAVTDYNYLKFYSSLSKNLIFF